MNSWSSLFWLLVLVLIFYVGFKVVPIYYKGFIGIRGICQENADIYHKYSADYIKINIGEALDNLGMPQKNRQIDIRRGKDTVYITITYRDTANFEDYYVKDFEFRHECQGVLKSVYQ